MGLELSLDWDPEIKKLRGQNHSLLVSQNWSVGKVRNTSELQQAEHTITIHMNAFDRNSRPYLSVENFIASVVIDSLCHLLVPDEHSKYLCLPCKIRLRI